MSLYNANNANNNNNNIEGDTCDFTALEFEVIRLQDPNIKIAPPIYVQTKVKLTTQPSLQQQQSSQQQAQEPQQLQQQQQQKQKHNSETSESSSLLPIDIPSSYYVETYPINSPNPEDWAQQETFTCFYDCHTFTGYPISIPFSYSARKGGYECFLKFCSFSCMLKEVSLNRDYNLEDIATNATRMATEVYGIVDPLYLAPPKMCLKLFGGSLDIDAYRKMSCLPHPIEIKLVRPPFYIAPAYLVSKPRVGHPQYLSAQHVYKQARSQVAAPIHFIPPPSMPPLPSLPLSSLPTTTTTTTITTTAAEDYLSASSTIRPTTTTTIKKEEDTAKLVVAGKNNLKKFYSKRKLNKESSEETPKKVRFAL